MTTKTSRRAILAGVAALPAISLPVLAGQSDRELLDLERELETAHARMNRAGEAHSKAEEKYGREKPAFPERPTTPASHEQLLETTTVGELAVLGADHPLNVWYRESEQQFELLMATHEAECHRLERKFEVDVTSEAFEKSIEEIDDIGHRIFAIPADTLDGIKVKLRTVELLETDDSNLGEAWASLKQDILALGAQSIMVQS